METITHNLIAIILQILCYRFFIFPFNIIFTIIFAFLSHIITDGIAVITYHTPEARNDDKFWVIWHIIIYAISIISIIIFIIPFWLAIIFANIMDLWDWFILRPIQKRKKKKNPESKWGNNLYFHIIVDWFRDKFLYWLPRWNYIRSGIIIEIFTIVITSLIIFFIL